MIAILRVTIFDFIPEEYRSIAVFITIIVVIVSGLASKTLRSLPQKPKANKRRKH